MRVQNTRSSEWCIDLYREFYYILKYNLRGRASFKVQVVIGFIVCVILLGRIAIEIYYCHKWEDVVQNRLLDYNEDELRPNWTFETNKNYDVSELRTYKPKPRILAKYNLPGKNGTPVFNSPSEKSMENSLYKVYGINIVASDKVSSNRSLPDFRFPECKKIQYPEVLPSVSVVMIVHNEAWSILMRAVWSVLNRSPDELLEEIILVDDFSDMSNLKKHLDEYLASKLPSKVKLVRTDKRKGLIRTRVIGAEHAKGQVLAFLDANVECNVGWLEPLLSRIASDRAVIAVPYIDVVNFRTIAYEHFEDGFAYGLDWSLFYRAYPIPEREWIRNDGDKTAPYRSPTLVGCAIVMDREFFFEIGTFDMGMDISGGENTELSLRTWQCGGAIEIVPCSRIGHVFRTHPYSFGDDKHAVKARNNIRIAKVWMDEYKPYFDVITPLQYRYLNAGDLSERLALREKLKCKSFGWFLENILPESTMIGGFRAIGQIQGVNRRICLDHRSNGQVRALFCHGDSFTQGFSYQKNYQIVAPKSECLSVSENSSKMNEYQVVVSKCSPTNGTKWSYDEKENRIVHLDSEPCLTSHIWMTKLAQCDYKDVNQKWTITSYEK